MWFCSFKPTHSLQQQMLRSYGSSAVLTLIVVVITAAICAQVAGDHVRARSNPLFRKQVVARWVRNSRFVSETIAAYFSNVEGTLQLMEEVMRDRIVGYPDEPGWEEDLYVPFTNRETGTNQYPLKADPLRLDWQIDRNVDLDNFEEHMQQRQRQSWKSLVGYISSSPAFFMQGVCDPDDSDRNSPTYYPNCTDANNNVTIGGKVQPTSTAFGLYQKSADIGWLALKPLFEAQAEARILGVYFSNSGAGATLQYPGGVYGAVVKGYTSDGCDWMLNDTNPYTERPFATTEEVARCHPKGEIVPAREYNPMDQNWIRDIAQSTNRTSWQTMNNSGLGPPTATAARGVYDRRTGHFIGCAVIHLEMEEVDKIVNFSNIDGIDLSIAKYSDNTVFADSLNGVMWANRHVAESGFISKDDLEKLRKAAGYSVPWTPSEPQKTLENIVVYGDHAMYTAYLLPPPPTEYDRSSSYEPQYWVIHAMNYTVFENVNAIQREVRQVTAISIIVGVLGMALTYAILRVVSKRLTDPLLWIQHVAWSIIYHDDKGPSEPFVLSEEASVAHVRHMKWVPATELTELVREFRAMIQGFSGKRAAALAKPETFEIPNQLTWQSVYQQLYARSTRAIEERRTVRFSSDISTDDPMSPKPEADLSSSNRAENEEAGMAAVGNTHQISFPGMNQELTIFPAPPMKNRGPNVRRASFRGRDGLYNELGGKINTCRSSLFWWTFLLVALPLICTNVTICALLSSHTLYTVGNWINVVGNHSQELELKALKTSTALKASQASMAINGVVRDLYFMTRLAGWLFFGGIPRSDSFTQMESAANECRGYDWDNRCPIYNDFERTPCDCAWEDLNDAMDKKCMWVNDTTGSSRSLQKRFFFCQAEDADEKTGNRVKAYAFFDGSQNASKSPETTLFWDDFDQVPGAFKGSDAAGFETTYDRVRVSSAMAVADIPLYNYATALGKSKHFIASYTALDADGMMTGYRGCLPGHLTASLFQSTEENHAADIAPHLCPLGKFGFDPRCREWYATGHRKYNQSLSPVYVTAPYLFASKTAGFAASATAPIVNPHTGEYAGQALLDFFPSTIKDAFDSLEDTIAFVVTPNASLNGGDTVLGPDRFDPGWSWKDVAIGDLLFKDEPNSSTYRRDFETDVLNKMKLGVEDLVHFQRTTNDSSPETLTLAFRPVSVRVLLPLDPTVLSRGANESKALVYSVGIAYRKSDVEQPWDEIEDDVVDDITSLQCALIITIAMVSILFIVLNFYITIRICKPVLILLRIVQSINRGQIDDDIPALKYCSCEVHQVYSCFAKLLKIIRISNVAFFSGNLELTYSIISDALNLFRRIGDEKAIGIACNNLGNTLHAVCKELLFDRECCSRIPGICSCKMALEHYDESVLNGQMLLDREVMDEGKAEFTQQLADRMFNRAMFLLLVDGEKCAPPDARATGLSDIQKVRQMDDDVKDFWIDRKLLLDHSEDFFLRLLQRANGLLEFDDDTELRLLWDAKDLVSVADQFLLAACDQPKATLFDRISKIGRLQQLETVAMRLNISRGMTDEAACLAMRKFAEDEFLIEDSFIMSSKVLLTILRGDPEWSRSWTSKAKKLVRADLRNMLRTCKQSTLDIGKCVVFATEINERWYCHTLLERINVRCLQLYDECCSRDDYIGLVAYTTYGDLNVPLSEKCENEGRQRTSLDLATTTTSEQVCPSFALAMQMLIDSPASSENDSFLLLFTDGYSWDSDSSTQRTMKAQLNRMNRDRETKMHIIILGMDVEDEETKEQCKAMCTVTKQSLYVDIDERNVDSVFDDIGYLIRGDKGRNTNQQGLIMEKF